jgi:hypothetical protein
MLRMSFLIVKMKLLLSYKIEVVPLFNNEKKKNENTSSIFKF